MTAMNFYEKILVEMNREIPVNPPTRGLPGVPVPRDAEDLYREYRGKHPATCLRSDICG
jgi:hypothetical protein